MEHDTQVRHRQLVHLKGWLSVVVRQLLLGHAAAMLSHSCSSVGGRVRALDGEVVLEAHCGIHLERERERERERRDKQRKKKGCGDNNGKCQKMNIKLQA